MKERGWRLFSIILGVVVMTITLGGFVLQPLDLATCQARGGIVLVSPDCDSV